MYSDVSTFYFILLSINFRGCHPQEQDKKKVIALFLQNWGSVDALFFKAWPPSASVFKTWHMFLLLPFLICCCYVDIVIQL